MSMHIAHLGVASDVPVLYNFGGAVQRRIWEMARLQARQGNRVVVYSFDAESSTREVDGVELRYLRCVSEHPVRQLEFQARALSDLSARDGRVDLLHVHSQPEAAILGRPVADITALSYDYFAFRGGNKAPFGGIYRRLLERFDLLLPCSLYCLRESAAHWRIDSRRMSVLHNGVNLEQFRPDPDRSCAELDALGIQEPVFLYVGRVCEQKGTHVLIEAARRLRERRVRARLVVAGPVGRFGRCDDGTWARRISDVGGMYLGPVAEERLAAIYGMASVAVMPTVDLEMFGMAAVEAQACGVPVIASDHGGLRETVPEEVGGRFPTGDAEALASRLERLLVDEDQRRVCAAAARENAGRFSWQRVCARANDLVSEARTRGTRQAI